MASKEPANIPTILKWGKKLQEDLNLSAVRRAFTFPFDMNPETPRETIIDFIRKLLGIEEFDADSVVIVHKTIPQPGLKWHIDDCVINNRKEPPSYNLEQYILLEANEAESKYRYLYFNTPTKRLPRYTLLFYSSTYGEDFTGGKLCLADGMEVLPQRGHGLLFDSREVHMVEPVKSGERRVSVVKIY
jgi:2OG-Fe(II) oxygenase superfamily